MDNMIHEEDGSFHNYLTKGCKLCQLGAKMVLFVTGICCRDCFYCPLSDKRRNDVVYANEYKVNCDQDIIEQARLMDALGTGITGGEPLLKPQRVLYYIKLLKSTFGPEHHIHLYTSTAPDKNYLTSLAEAGLDEIRFHPPYNSWADLEGSGYENALLSSLELGMEAGLELPSIQNVKNVCRLVEKNGGFLNLNELEFSDTNAPEMKKKGFVLENDISNAVRGSRLVASGAAPHVTKFHFCSSCYKDAVQLRKRLLRIAKNTAREFDEITEDGTLLHGHICGNCVEDIAKDLEKYRVPLNTYEAVTDGVDIGWWILEEIGAELKEKGYEISLIERYPLKESFIVEIIPM